MGKDVMEASGAAQYIIERGGNRLEELADAD